jgi:hypothetical protein
MTAVDEDATAALLTSSEDQDVSDTWISDAFEDYAKVTRAHHDLLVRYNAHLREDTEFYERVKAATERHALEVAQARSEVLQQVRAQVLSTGVTTDTARDLLGSFWRDT